MAAKRLPSTGAPTITGEKLCDTDGIFIIHNLFRRMFAEAPGLVREVAPGDVARAKIVQKNLAELSAGLHTHHTTEDELLWDRLETRAPSCAVHVGQMREQHAEVGSQLDAIDDRLAAWATDAASADRDLLAAMLDRLSDTLGAHLGQEEAEILPVAQVAMTQREWDALGEHARKATPRDRLFIELGLIVDSVPAAKRAEWFAQEVPAPVRVIYRLFGRRKYEAAMAELFPGRPIPTMA